MKILEKLPPWANNLLVIYGLITMLFVPGVLIYEKASLNNAVAFVLPICERYVLGETTSDDITGMLLGVNIVTVNPALNVRVRFSNVFSAITWGMYSDGLSDQEAQAFLSELTEGNLPDEFVTPPLPDLAADTTTILTFLGVTNDEEHCNTQHVTVTTTQGDIYHASPGFRQLREFPALFLGPFEVTFLAYLLPILELLSKVVFRRLIQAAA